MPKVRDWQRLYMIVATCFFATLAILLPPLVQDTLAQNMDEVTMCRTQPVQFQAACIAAIRAKPTPAKPTTVAPAAPRADAAVQSKPVGRPLCADQDSLSRLLVADVLAKSGQGSADDAATARAACETIPAGARVVVLERIASGSSFLRIVKVKVTSPKLREPTTGYTVEMDQ
jgi:hypothetical protein